MVSGHLAHLNHEGNPGVPGLQTSIGGKEALTSNKLIEFNLEPKRKLILLNLMLYVPADKNMSHLP